MADTEQPDLTAMTVQLLSAYFSNNQVPADDIAGIIEATRGALEGKNEAEAPAPVEHVPAVSVRKSLGSREHIISMIDGKPYKTLKRHLATNGLTPAEYRERYKLPRDYPMVAPAYSEHRRAVAEKLGLGRKAGETVQKEAPASDQAVEDAAPPPAPVKESKPQRPRGKASAVKSAHEVSATAAEQTPESASASAPGKPKRTRARVVAVKPTNEPVVASEPTPETIVAAETPSAPAPAASPTPAPVAARAPTPKKTKVVATKAAKKKPVAKKAAPKAADEANKAAPVEPSAAAPTTPEATKSEAATPEAETSVTDKPAPRKKKLGIVTGPKSAASPKPKVPAQQAKTKNANNSADEEPALPKRRASKKAAAASASEVAAAGVSGKN